MSPKACSAARAARALAAHHGIEMPICEAVDRVLHEGLSPRVAVLELLRREPRPEGALTAAGELIALALALHARGLPHARIPAAATPRRR